MKFNTHRQQIEQQITQSELADILGLKPTAISNYESSRNEPSFEKLIILAKIFDVSCDYLLGISDSYISNSGKFLDKDIEDFLEMYQQLDQENIKELKNYLQYLLYKQKH